jgi:hypothetical protein
MANNYKAVGYSNGIPYFLIEYDLQTNMGLLELEEWIFPVWCLFDKIVKYEER